MKLYKYVEIYTDGINWIDEEGRREFERVGIEKVEVERKGEFRIHILVKNGCVEIENVKQIEIGDKEVKVKL